MTIPRRVMTGVVAVSLLALLAASKPMTQRAEISLYTESAAITTGGERVALRSGVQPEFIDGTRVLSDAENAPHLAGDQREWLAKGSVPYIGARYEDMITKALLDLHTLTLDNGAALAGWSPHWRYVWPRDAAFVAAALAATGHSGDARKIVAYLQDVQTNNGLFHARYLPDGSGEPPDNRGIQLDGSGWALWAVRKVSETLENGERQEFLRASQSLIDRSTTVILTLIANPSALPPASPDYWEVKEKKLTLGTVAPLLAGLESSVTIYDFLGDVGASRQAAEGAKRLEAALSETFAPDYPRYAGGSEQDMAVMFLMPPISEDAKEPEVKAWHVARQKMRRPAGGLAPGAAWKNDGVSWTPPTALDALVSASMGHEEAARYTLSWLNAHRTGHGALPEKVLADGSPAAVAPLAWTAALVVLAACEIDQRGHCAQ